MAPGSQAAGTAGVRTRIAAAGSPAAVHRPSDTDMAWVADGQARRAADTAASTWEQYGEMCVRDGRFVAIHLTPASRNDAGVRSIQHVRVAGLHDANELAPHNGGSTEDDENDDAHNGADLEPLRRVDVTGTEDDTSRT